MKRIFILSFSLLIHFTSCENFLEEKNETNLSVDFIYDTPEGIGFAVTALYPMARQMHRVGDSGGENSLTTVGLYSGDDITFVRAGSANWAGLGWYDQTKLTPSNADVEAFWAENYKIVGKANEILFYASKLDQSNIKVRKSMGEAYCFRAKAYFDLYRRFDNIFINNNIFTPDNVDDQTIEYIPSSETDIVKQIKSDLDEAIKLLEWTTNDIGRFTQGVARHMKLMVDMWPVDGLASNMDLDDAIIQLDEIEKSGVYKLLSDPKDVFTPSAPVNLVSAKLNSTETILVEQWSNGVGGGSVSSSGDVAGHRLASSFLARYDQLPGGGVTQELAQGGTSWGRIFPNEYLLSLYDQNNDKRYSQYFNHWWKFNNIKTTLNRKIQITQELLDIYNSGYPLGVEIPEGASVGSYIEMEFKNGDTIPRVMSSNYALYLYPSVTKYFDAWTRAPKTNPSFKDIIIYRLAETYLLGAEAYLRKGDQNKALFYYNKTWERAGNEKREMALTLQDLLDEDARELCLEGFGHRWYTLKRFGKEMMFNQITTYAGSENKLHSLSYNTSTGNLTSPPANINNYNSYFSLRNNFANSKKTVNGKEVIVYMRWPIPYAQIQSMGGNYPQNLGY